MLSAKKASPKESQKGPGKHSVLPGPHFFISC